MANADQVELMRIISPELAERAVDLTQRAGSSEFCFPLGDGESVLDALLEAGVVPLGGDLWEVEDGEYFPTGESWYVNSIEGESVVDRVNRVGVAARSFFEVHRAVENGWVTFVVAV